MKSKLSGYSIDFTSSLKLRLKNQIGTGSFSDVYSTSDPHYVVKMINAMDPKSLHSYKNEKYAFQNIKKHENIIYCPAFLDSVVLKDLTFCCLVLENCPKGSLINMMVDKKITFPENQIIQIFLDLLVGIHQMHTLPTPIAHRDLKGENILLGEDGHFKLTDFGSISTTHIQEVTKENREIIEDDLNKNTTPTIRAPEQCDLFSGFPITEKVDIWALGCLLFIMCFQKQPFETRLATINCQYFISNTPKYSKPLLNLFDLLFVTDPRKRPNTTFLLNHFEANFYALPKGIFATTTTEARTSVKGNRTPKKTREKEEKFLSSFGDFGKVGLPQETPKQNSDVKVRPSFSFKCQRYFKSLTTKTEAWVLSVQEESEESPKQKYVRYLLIKAWQKSHKIQKFYVILHRRYAKFQENTIIVLKTLIVLHNYTKKGPNEVYSQGSTSSVAYPKDLLVSIYDAWRVIFEKNTPSFHDKLRDVSTNKIITDYSDLLKRKVDLMKQYSNIIEGNYSLNPYFSGNIIDKEKEKLPLQIPFIDDLLNYLQALINFHKALLLSKNLWKIQCNIVLTVLDEEYCLVSLLTHLIVALKKSSNYTPSLVDQETLQRLEEKFVNSYEKLQKIFETVVKTIGFERYSATIPLLPKQIVPGLKSIPAFSNRNGDYVIKEHLTSHKSIYGLKIPQSYGDFFKGVNLQNMIDIEDTLTEPSEQPLDKGVVNLGDNPQKASRKQNDRNVNNQLRDRGLNKEFAFEFKPNFEAFNQTQNSESTKIANQENFVSNQFDIYAGFNFGKPMNQNYNTQNAISPLTPLKEDQIFREDVSTSKKVENIQEKQEPIEPKVTIKLNKEDVVGESQKLPEIHTEVKNELPLSLDDAVLTAKHQEVKKESVKLEEENNFESPERDIMYKNIDDESEFESPPRKTEHTTKDVTAENKQNGSNANSSPPQDELIMMPITDQRKAPQRAKAKAALKRMQSGLKSNEASPPSQDLEQVEEENNKQYLNLSGDEELMNLDDQFPGSQNQYKEGIGSQSEEEEPKPSPPVEQRGRGKQGPLRRNIRGQTSAGASRNDLDNNQEKQISSDEEKKEEPLERLERHFIKKSGAPVKLQNLNLGGAQFKGDSGIEPEHSSSGLRESEKGSANLKKQGEDNGRMRSQERKKSYYEGLKTVDKEEEEEKHGDMYKKEIGEFTLESLLGGKKSYKKPNLPVGDDSVKQRNQARRRSLKPSMVNKAASKEEGKEEGKVEGEWQNVFDIEKNLSIQKKIDSKEEIQIPSYQNLENSSLSGQEITSTNLKNFIYNEVSKNMASWIINYNQLKFLHKIGNGGSSQVYKGLWRGSDVAIKKMDLSQLSEGRKREFEREISALMKLRPHQNLVNLIGVSLHENDLCIVTEFCSGGTLFSWLHEMKNFPITWKQKVKMAIDVASGMNYLHTYDPPIIHRDLKSLNLLLDAPLEKESKRFTIKLADFGLAKAEQEINEQTQTTITGTFHWMAPEIFESQTCTVKADIYSFGIVLWEIITRETPYSNIKTPLGIMKYVTVEKKRPDLSLVPPNCPKELVQLMVKCWSHNPQDRPDFSEILEQLKFLNI